MWVKAGAAALDPADGVVSAASDGRGCWFHDFGREGGEVVADVLCGGLWCPVTQLPAFDEDLCLLLRFALPSPIRPSTASFRWFVLSDWMVGVGSGTGGNPWPSVEDTT